MRTTILFLLLLFGACDPGSEGATVDVEVSQFRFQPETLTTEAGSTVTWTNLDEIDHTVTAGTPERPEIDAFDHVFEATPPNSFSFTFDEPGTYSYFCARHDFMQGEIHVK